MLTVVECMKVAKEVFGSGLKGGFSGAIEMITSATDEVERRDGSDLAWSFLCDAGGSYALLIMLLADAPMTSRMSCSLEVSMLAHEDEGCAEAFFSNNLEDMSAVEATRFLLGAIPEGPFRSRAHSIIRLMDIADLAESRRGKYGDAELQDLLRLNEDIWKRARHQGPLSPFLTALMPWEDVAHRIEVKSSLVSGVNTLEVGKA